MSKQLLWGIVSAGAISEDFAKAFQTLDQSKQCLNGVAASSFDKAHEFAKKFNIPNVYDDYEKLFQSDKIHVVYIGAINTMHKDLCLKAFENGKHILCEKPMCMNRQEQEEIFKKAKEKNLFFMEALWSRFFPLYDRLRDEIFNKKSLGEVKMFQGNYLTAHDKERVKSKELGGGDLFDVGIYPIQLACLVFDHEKPIEIVATGFLRETGTDVAGNITLKYSNERLASIAYHANVTRHQSAIIAGDKGIIRFPNYSSKPTEMILPNGELIKSPLPDIGETHFSHSAGLRYEAEATRIAIEQGLIEHPYAKWDHSRLILDILEESRKQIGYKLAQEEGKETVKP